MISLLTEKDTENLLQFFGGCFHQDWDAEYPDPDAVLSSFWDGNTVDEVLQNILNSLDVLCESKLSEEELERFLVNDCGCEYYYLADWPSTKAWLKHIIDFYSNGQDQEAEDDSEEERPPSIHGGATCSQEGWWMSPADSEPRRYFKKGEVMPESKSDYGKTIWQWCEDQDSE